MKIYYASDIHSEYFNRIDIPHVDFVPPVIVLAGDIGVADQTLDFLMALTASYPHTDIVWVAGNHEFYGVNIDAQLNVFRQFSATHPRVHFLENNAVELHSVTFLGCTLWTDFSVLGEKMQAECIGNCQRLADFYYIQTQTGRFTPEDASARFRESYQWLDSQLATGNPRKTVVVSHFPPCREARHGEISEDSLAAYFQANAKSLIDRHQPYCWIYGHNHWSDQLHLGNTLLTSNQLGYPRELKVQERFDIQAYIEI